MVFIHLADAGARLAHGILGVDKVLLVGGQFHLCPIHHQQRAEFKALHNALCQIAFAKAGLAVGGEHAGHRAVLVDHQQVAGGFLVAVKLTVADDQAIVVLVVVVVAVKGEHSVVAQADFAGRLGGVGGIRFACKGGLQLIGARGIDIGHEEAAVRVVKRVAPAINGDFEGIALIVDRILDGLAVGLGRRHGEGGAQRQRQKEEKRQEFFHRMILSVGEGTSSVTASAVPPSPRRGRQNSFLSPPLRGAGEVIYGTTPGLP